MHFNCLHIHFGSKAKAKNVMNIYDEKENGESITFQSILKLGYKASFKIWNILDYRVTFPSNKLKWFTFQYIYIGVFTTRTCKL